MPRYAATTEVPVERSRAEIESVLTKHGATSFHSGWDPGLATVGFRLKELYIRFALPIPARTDREFQRRRVRGSWSQATEAQIDRAHDQEVRRRWRALALVVKAKLEAVESKISTLEQEFLSFIVMPNNQSIGEWLADNAMRQIRAGQMPLAIAGPPKSSDVIDAEFTSKEES